MTTKMQSRIYGNASATDVEIRPLNEENAVQSAVDLLGELFVFSVQRSARAEARKEEQCKQELGFSKQRNEDLANEVELLKHRLQELEQLAREQGLCGIINFRHGNTESGKTVKLA